MLTELMLPLTGVSYLLLLRHGKSNSGCARFLGGRDLWYVVLSLGSLLPNLIMVRLPGLCRRAPARARSSHCTGHPGNTPWHDVAAHVGDSLHCLPLSIAYPSVKGSL